MGISVTAAISPAIDWAKRVCFQPFDASKWFILGFCAWLAQLGQGGFNFNFNFPTERGHSSRSQGDEWEHFLRQVMDWMTAHLTLVIVLAAIFLVVLIVVMLVLAWVSSRGRFMFLDGVVHNRALIVEPWKQFRELANSLFIFRIVFGLTSFIILMLLAGLVFAMGAISGAMGVVLLVLGLPVLLLWAITLGVIYSVLENFVVPTMYLRNVRVNDAWHIVRSELLPGNGGTLVRFLLMKFVIGLATGMIVLGLICGTCCISLCVLMIPYIGTVALLPLFVFSRSYPLYVLEQFGEDWRFFPPPEMMPPELPPAPQWPPTPPVSPRM